MLTKFNLQNSSQNMDALNLANVKFSVLPEI